MAIDDFAKKVLQFDLAHSVADYALKIDQDAQLKGELCGRMVSRALNLTVLPLARLVTAATRVVLLLLILPLGCHGSIHNRVKAASDPDMSTTLTFVAHYITQFCKELVTSPFLLLGGISPTIAYYLAFNTYKATNHLTSLQEELDNIAELEKLGDYSAGVVQLIEEFREKITSAKCVEIPVFLSADAYVRRELDRKYLDALAEEIAKKMREFGDMANSPEREHHRKVVNQLLKRFVNNSKIINALCPTIQPLPKRYDRNLTPAPAPQVTSESRTKNRLYDLVCLGLEIDEKMLALGSIADMEERKSRIHFLTLLIDIFRKNVSAIDLLNQSQFAARAKKYAIDLKTAVVPKDSVERHTSERPGHMAFACLIPAVEKLIGKMHQITSATEFESHIANLQRNLFQMNKTLDSFKESKLNNFKTLETGTYAAKARIFYVAIEETLKNLPMFPDSPGLISRHMTTFRVLERDLHNIWTQKVITAEDEALLATFLLKPDDS